MGEQVADGIACLIAGEGGRVTFARFMEWALTHPVQGYYSRAERILGAHGDFSTAPVLSPEFGRAVARLVLELLDAAVEEGYGGGPGPTGAPEPARGSRLAGEATAQPPTARPAVVELGGGEGHLARSLLTSWGEARPDLRDRLSYCIVEVSAGLRRRQEEALQDLRAGGWDVRWGDDLEQVCRGTSPAVVLGNEFIDALPVHVVDVSGSDAREAWVEVGGTAGGAGLAWKWGALSPEAAAELTILFGSQEPERLRPLTGDGILELRPSAADLLAQAARVMPAGSLLIVDYGAWYGGLGAAGRPAAASGDTGPTDNDTRPPDGVGRLHDAAGPPGGPARGAFTDHPEGGPADGPEAPAPLRRRTVRGYFRHQLISDPLERPGRQDLTADVDFAALDLHGRKAGFETVVFASLAAFLAAGGAERPPAARGALCSFPSGLSPEADLIEADRQATVLGALLDEEGLGGSFKVMLQVLG